jgi:hypothetical protein
MQATKMGELHSNLAKAAFRPAEQAIAAMQGTKYAPSVGSYASHR